MLHSSHLNRKKSEYCLKQQQKDNNNNKKTMAYWLSRWYPNPGVPCSKPLGGSKVDSAFHPSEVDKMSTRNSWELSGKK